MSEKWIDTVCNFITNTQNENKRPVIIAIARKMVRLLEVYMHHPKLRNVLTTSNASLKRIDPVVISEHAIPSYLSKFRKKDANVLILDDLIITGFSSNKVAINVEYATGIHAKNAAIYKLIEENNADKTKFESITANQFPAYTTFNSIKILNLQRPIDVEYPILKSKIKHPVSNEEFQRILQLIQEQFPPDLYSVYPVIHHIKYSGKDIINRSITILFNDNNPKARGYDFCKIRIFFGKDEISIAVYAPKILPEHDLNASNALFSNSPTDLALVWSHFCKTVDHNTKIAEERCKENNRNLNIFRYIEYQNRHMSSKVVWANYLYSLIPLQSVLPQISKILDSTIGIDRFDFSPNDLAYLIGPVLAHIYYNNLFNYLNTLELYETENTPLQLTLRKERSILPPKIKEEYEKELSDKIDFSLNLSQALSSIFSEEHYNVGYVSRNKTDEFNLLRVKSLGDIRRTKIINDVYSFGETYSTLYNLVNRPLTVYGKVSMPEIHQWIDPKIDLGIVIPKYESSSDLHMQNYWRRYFRAGENEDTYIKLARLIVNEIDAYLTIRHTAKNNRPENIPNRWMDMNDMDIIYQSAKEKYHHYGDLLPFTEIDELNAKLINPHNYVSLALTLYLVNLGVLKSIVIKVENSRKNLYAVARGKKSIARILRQGLPL